MSIMLDAKNARKRAEADVQLLANRLQHLKMAEERARRKIVETKSRTGEIMTLKKRNMEHQQSKMNHNMERELSVTSEQKRVNSQRNMARKHVQDSKEVLERTRKAQAGAQREQMRTMSEWKEEQALKEEARNRQRNSSIRRRRDALKKKKDAELAAQERRLQEEYAKKVSQEAERTREAENLIMRMESEEAALIERLRRTQEMQRAAYEELQTTLQL